MNSKLPLSPCRVPPTSQQNHVSAGTFELELDGLLDDSDDEDTWLSSNKQVRQLVCYPGSYVLDYTSWIIRPGSYVLDHTSWIIRPGSYVLGHASWGIVKMGKFASYKYKLSKTMWYMFPGIKNKM